MCPQRVLKERVTHQRHLNTSAASKRDRQRTSSERSRGRSGWPTRVSSCWVISWRWAAGSASSPPLPCPSGSSHRMLVMPSSQLWVCTRGCGWAAPRRVRDRCSARSLTPCSRWTVSTMFELVADTVTCSRSPPRRFKWIFKALYAHYRHFVMTDDYYHIWGIMWLRKYAYSLGIGLNTLWNDLGSWLSDIHWIISQMMEKHN